MTDVRAVELTFEDDEAACFLCSPAAELVYAESKHFMAMLGLGPIAEGYSLIAARDHVPSMLDLSAPYREELVEFTRTVRDMLAPHYGSSLVTEHGRVAPCLDRVVRTYEPHCLHAHRLVFPGTSHIELQAAAPRLHVQTYDSFADAAAGFRDTGQYVFVERADGTCQIASVYGRFPRQFFRRVVASAANVPDLADWRAHPRLDLIHAARLRLLTGK